MPINDLLRELDTPNTVPDMNQFEAIVGDVLTFTNPQSVTTPVTTLTQKPAGSSAAVVSNAFTCDVTGVYLVTQSSGGNTRNYTIYCFAAQNATYPGRGVLRQYLGQIGQLGVGQTSPLRTILESASPANVLTGVNFKPWGG
jgi:hypothetical protein